MLKFQIEFQLTLQIMNIIYSLSLLKYKEIISKYNGRQLNQSLTLFCKSY